MGNLLERVRDESRWLERNTRVDSSQEVRDRRDLMAEVLKYIETVETDTTIPDFLRRQLKEINQ
jgi:L-fucose isomerase-like protein